MNEEAIVRALAQQIEQEDLHLGNCVFLSDVLDLLDQKDKAICGLKSKDESIVKKFKECMLDVIAELAENVQHELWCSQNINTLNFLETVSKVAKEMGVE